MHSIWWCSSVHNVSSYVLFDEFFRRSHYILQMDLGGICDGTGFLSFYNTFHSGATRLCYRIEPSIKDTLSQKRFLMEIQRKMTLENWPLKVSKDLLKWPKHLCKVYNCCKKFYLHDAGSTFLSFSWLAIDFILGDNDWARSWLPQTKAKCAAQGWSNDICSV